MGQQWPAVWSGALTKQFMEPWRADISPFDPLGEELAISGLRWVALEGCGERQALIQSSAGFPTFAFEAENGTPHRYSGLI